MDKQGLSYIITLEARRNSQSHTAPDPDSGPEALGILSAKLDVCPSCTIHSEVWLPHGACKMKQRRIRGEGEGIS